MIKTNVTDEVPRYFNIFKCGRNIFNRLDLKYKRECMTSTKKNTKMLETLADYNDHNNAPLYNGKLRRAVSKVMEEMEGEERDFELNAKNVTMDTFCYQSPVTTNTQGEI